jgi:cytochrome c553
MTTMRLLRLILTFSLLPIAGTASAATKYFPERQPACLACHGENGTSPTPETPSLGGISEFYALLQLVEFRDGNRKSDIMREVVKGMTDDDLRAAAKFVGEQPRSAPPKEKGDPERMKRGADLVEKNRCNQCHGKELLGGEQMPPLRHQREDYIQKSLLDYKTQTRIDDRAAMSEIAAHLTEAEIGDLAHYLAHLPD